MKITILGAGAYALALASIFDNNKHKVSLWTFSIEEEKQLKTDRISPKLKGYKIPTNITITTDMKEATKDARLIVIAVPAHAIDETAKELKQHITKKEHILIATKGIENETCYLMTEILEKHINTKKLGVISGPTFAVDIIKKHPIGLTLASLNSPTKKLICSLMENSYTKIKTTKDIIGVQICGAIKNVIAIACGILEGMNTSDSTKALFLTEALNDIKELIKDLSGNQNTILLYAGLGDILLTSTSTNSRNFTYGKLIGEEKLEEANHYAKTNTIEGLYTLKSIKELLKREHIKIYIIDLINDIINNKKDKKELLEFLVYK